jgi:PadR family transcriptional regulator, regulatory protein PadR
MTNETPLLLGTLDLLILKALSLEPMHGLGAARRVAQMTGGAYIIGAGSLFPALHRLEERGWLAASWGQSENNRKAKFYKLTGRGRKQLAREAQNWEQATAILARFLSPKGDPA